jgi:hypothetical protein
MANESFMSYKEFKNYFPGKSFFDYISEKQAFLEQRKRNIEKGTGRLGELNPKFPELCLKFRRMYIGEIEKNIVFQSGHLVNCPLCERWYKKNKRSNLYEGIDLWETEQPNNEQSVINRL